MANRSKEQAMKKLSAKMYSLRMKHQCQKSLVYDQSSVQDELASIIEACNCSEENYMCTHLFTMQPNLDGKQLCSRK